MAEHKGGQDIGANPRIFAPTRDLMLRRSKKSASCKKRQPEKKNRFELSGARGADDTGSASPGDAWCPGDGPEQFHMGSLKHSAVSAQGITAKRHSKPTKAECLIPGVSCLLLALF